MIDYLRMLFTEFLLLFNIGITIKIKITLKCNLHCTYCCITIADGHRATFDELTADEWVQVVENFPFKVRKVILIGGEPFMRKDAPELINRLTAKKIIVKAESNGLYHRMLEVNPTPFYKAITTFHHEMNQAQKDHWREMYEYLKTRYRILVNEITESEVDYVKTQLMPLVSAGDVGCYFRRDFIFMPNGQLVQCIQDACSFEGHQPKVQWAFSEPKDFYSIYDVKEKIRIMFWNNIKSRVHRLLGLKMKGW